MAVKNAEENFASVFFCPWFSSKIEVVQMGVYEESWFPFRFFNLLPIFNVWAIRSTKNTGVDSHSFFQRIFRTQGSNLDLLHFRQTLFNLSHQGSPCYLYFAEKLNLSIILHSFFLLLLFVCLFCFLPFNTEIILITITNRWRDLVNCS